MIVSGTVPSAPVQGVTVQGPADVNPPNGAGVMAQNGKWVLNPGESFVLAALGTAVATATASMIVDWTTAGCFAVTAYGGGWTITFNNAAGEFTPQLGQAILLNITHAASSAITWPSTITWFGPSSAPRPPPPTIASSPWFARHGLSPHLHRLGRRPGILTGRCPVLVFDTPTAKARGILSSTPTARTSRVLHWLPERCPGPARKIRACPALSNRLLGISRRARWSSARPGTRRVARRGYPSIMVDVLRGDLLPTTVNIELPKSQPNRTGERPYRKRRSLLSSLV